MPNVILDRISLPNLKLYTSVSVVLVACCVYYAINATSDPFWRIDNNVTSSESFFSLDLVFGSDGIQDSSAFDSVTIEANDGNVEYDGPMLSMLGHSDYFDPQSSINRLISNLPPDQRKLFNDTRTIGTKCKDAVSFMVQEPICVWVSQYLIHFICWLWSYGLLSIGVHRGGGVGGYTLP